MSWLKYHVETRNEFEHAPIDHSSPQGKKEIQYWQETVKMSEQMDIEQCLEIIDRVHVADDTVVSVLEDLNSFRNESGERVWNVDLPEILFDEYKGSDFSKSLRATMLMWLGRARQERQVGFVKGIYHRNLVQAGEGENQSAMNGDPSLASNALHSFVCDIQPNARTVNVSFVHRHTSLFWITKASIQCTQPW